MSTQSMGMYIRKKRNQNGWTQEQLAEMLNVSARQIGTWERDASSIKYENLEKLSQALQVSIAEIMAGKDIPALDEDTKVRLNQEIKNLSERVADVQTITIKVEDRGLLSMEMGIYAFGISIVSIAIACWAASPRTPLISLVCLILSLFGIGFAICGKRIVSSLTQRVRKRRDQQDT